MQLCSIFSKPLVNVFSYFHKLKKKKKERNQPGTDQWLPPGHTVNQYKN